MRRFRQMCARPFQIQAAFPIGLPPAAECFAASPAAFATRRRVWTGRKVCRNCTRPARRILPGRHGRPLAAPQWLRTRSPTARRRICARGRKYKETVVVYAKARPRGESVWLANTVNTTAFDTATVHRPHRKPRSVGGGRGIHGACALSRPCACPPGRSS